MPLGDHPFDEINVQWCGVDCSFSNIVAGDKECSLVPVALQNIQQLRRIEIWPIVVC